MSQYSQSINDDIQKGIQSTINVGRAAVKAASGNIIGAAVDVLRDDGLRKLALGILIAILFFATVLCYYVPMSIWEGVKSFGEMIMAGPSDEYYEYYYYGAYDRDMAASMAAGQTLADTFAKYADWIKTAIAIETGKDTVDETDFAVFDDENAGKEIYLRKIEAIKDKFDAKAKVIESAVQGSASGGAIYKWVRDNLYYADRESFAAELGIKAEDIKFDGVDLYFTNQSISTRDCIRLMSLYSVLYNESEDNIQPYALMRWMGYLDSGQHVYAEGDTIIQYQDRSVIQRTIEYTIGDEVTFQIDAWQGDFLPKYIIEEAQQIVEKDPSISMNSLFPGKRCAAVDILMTVTSQSLRSLSPVLHTTANTEMVYDYIVKSEWVLMSQTQYERGQYAEKNTPVGQSSAPDVNKSIAKAGYKYYYITHLVKVPREVTTYTYSISYELSVSTTCRSVKELLRYAGLYELDLDNAESAAEYKSACEKLRSYRKLAQGIQGGVIR